jgi:hypothetical protein
MSKSKSKVSPAQAAGRNSRRSLDAIAGDLHRADRQGMFTIGKLLAEARDVCERGEWKKWLENEDNGFSWTYRTALNYIAAYELVSKYETVSHLRVPARTIYALAELAEIDGKNISKELPDVKGVDDPAMPAIIAALKEASQKKRLTYTEADTEISFAVLRYTWGNYPDATLSALDRLPTSEHVSWAKKYADWVPGAIDALKRKKTDDEDVANGIVNNCHLKHLERIYGGALPTWLTSNLLPFAFDDLEAEHRPEIRRRLNEAKEPLDFNQVMALVYEVQKGEPTDAKHEPTDAKPIDHKPVGDPDHKPSNLEKQLAADRERARDLVKLNRGTAQSLREILTNLKRREAFVDALIRALSKSSSSDDPVKSAEVRTAVNAAAEEKAA